MPKRLAEIRLAEIPDECSITDLYTINTHSVEANLHRS